MAQRLDYGGVRCSECGRQVDEFTTIAERWLYYSDGRDLLAYCPDCARREFSGDAPERAASPRSPRHDASSSGS